MNNINQIPPHSVETEISILGSVLIDNHCHEVFETVKVEHFYKSAHQNIYKAMMELYSKNIPIDLMTLSEKLKNLKRLDEIGGQYYLTTLMESVASSANIKSYIEILIEKYNLRKALSCAHEIMKMVCEDETSETIYERIGSLSIQNIIDHKQFYMHEILIETCNEIDRRKAGEIFSLKTGIEQLDRIVDFEYGDLIVVGAYSSHGKTSLALQIALHIIMSFKYVLFYELEMTRKSLAARMIAMLAKVDSRRLWHGNLLPDESPKVHQAIGELSSAPLIIDDTPAVSLEYIRAKSRQCKRKHDLKMIIVDYLNLMDVKGENKEDAISNTTRGLKSLAKELNIVVVLLSQFRRHEGTRFNKRPSMSDLKGSAAIEQDADKVLIPWLPNLRKTTEELSGEDRHKAILIIDKHRSGQIADIDLIFNERYTKFE